jgi:vesicle-fusing ATPase
MKALTVAVSVFTFIFGWITYLFTNFPRMFFAGIIVTLILLYVMYRFFVKGRINSIVKKINSLNKKSEAPLAATRVEVDDEDKIAGLDTQLDEIYKQITLPRSINEKLRNDLGLRNVRGIILHGPPGTGKTMLARNLAKKLGCKSIEKTSAVSLIDKYYGSTEEHIRELFVHKPGELHMVILDEIDSICPTRTSGMNDSRFYTGVTNQLLSLMDGIDADPDVIVVGTTNNMSSIDPAILRPGRFDIHLEIKMPDDEARTNIFRVYTEKLIEKGLMEKYDMDSLIERTKGFTGANIENTVRKAITSALYRHNEDKEPFQILETDIISSI